MTNKNFVPDYKNEQKKRETKEEIKKMKEGGVTAEGVVKVVKNTITTIIEDTVKKT